MMNVNRFARVLGVVLATSSPVWAAGPVLFTTLGDFSGWIATGTGGSPVASPSTVWDSDGVSVNGSGNANPGAAGVGGSLKVVTGGEQYGSLISSDVRHTNAFALLAPGSSSTQTVASSGRLFVTYSVPTDVRDFGLALDLRYDGDGYYDPRTPVAVVDNGVINGLVTRTAEYQYSIFPGVLTEFEVRLDYSVVPGQSSVFYVDAIAVPEPGALGSAGVVLLTLAARRRRA